MDALGLYSKGPDEYMYLRPVPADPPQCATGRWHADSQTYM